MLVGLSSPVNPSRTPVAGRPQTGTREDRVLMQRTTRQPHPGEPPRGAGARPACMHDAARAARRLDVED